MVGNRISLHLVNEIEKKNWNFSRTSLLFDGEQ